MIAIQPINFLGKEATQLDIRVKLKPNAETSTAFYNVKDSEGGYLYDGIVEIPKQVHSAWGVDDSVIEDYVLEKLNLNRD